MSRGSILQESKDVINGERQDQYGSPENSFELISEYWSIYLHSVGCTFSVTKENVAMMMTLFKIARESNQHKRDNIRDAAGYLGIYADMLYAKISEKDQELTKIIMHEN